MDKSFKTYLKHAGKDYYNQSVNPPVVRASTLIFKSIEDIIKTRNKSKKNPIGGHFIYGREGSSTTFALQQMLRKIEESYQVFLAPTGFGSVFLAIFSVVRPGNEILLSDSIYSPTRLLTENFLKVSDLILPIFLTYEANSTEIDMMPHIKRNNINDAVLLANKAYEAGIKAVAIFPEVPEEKKDVLGKEALNENNIVCEAVRAIKKNVKGIGVICDVALDPYTISGHDGILENNQIDNDKTVEILCKQAIVNAEAGCDVIAPSDMMDGRIGVIRDRLDNEGFGKTIILSYAGIKSLEFDSEISEVFPPEKIIPSAGQGIIALQCREQDEKIISILKNITVTYHVLFDFSVRADSLFKREDNMFCSYVKEIRNQKELFVKF